MNKKTRLLLNSVRNVRESIARVVRRIHDNEYADNLPQARLELDFLKTVLLAFKQESDMRVEQEVKEIRRTLKDKGLL